MQKTNVITHPSVIKMAYAAKTQQFIQIIKPNRKWRTLATAVSMPVIVNPEFA